MKVIGIAGGVGCGKSLVLDLIKDNFNAYIVKADDISRNILDKDTAGYYKVLEIFGDTILKSDDTIDRAKLADIVFNSKNKLMVLNSIVHPLVKSKIIEIMGDIRCAGNYDYFIVEAALLFDDHYEMFCDETWYIYADVDTRKRRLKESRGYSEEKCESIMSNQMSEDEFRLKCDFVINNSGTVDETLIQLKKMLVVE